MIKIIGEISYGSIAICRHRFFRVFSITTSVVVKRDNVFETLPIGVFFVERDRFFWYIERCVAMRPINSLANVVFLLGTPRFQVLHKHLKILLQWWLQILVNLQMLDSCSL